MNVDMNRCEGARHAPWLELVHGDALKPEESPAVAIRHGNAKEREVGKNNPRDTKFILSFPVRHEKLATVMKVQIPWLALRVVCRDTAHRDGDDWGCSTDARGGEHGYPEVPLHDLMVMVVSSEWW